MKTREEWKREVKAAEQARGWQGRYRMKYHLMPPVGWLNDPNGLCQFQGVYHVFFQYDPLYGTDSGKFWGHYTSKDLVSWNYEGLALFPDRQEDRNGVYSGSAWIRDGEMHLFYTGNVKLKGDYDYIDRGRESCQLGVTSRDGLRMSEKQKFLGMEDYPPEYTAHIRDPKIYEKDGRFYMALGGRKRWEQEGTRLDRGAILVYESADLETWKLAGEIESRERFGYMWECPDLFDLGGRTVVSFSPQGVPGEARRFQNVYQSGYGFLSAPFEGRGWGTRTVDGFREWDMGFDFYAPQSFQGEDGRRLLLAWASVPDSEKEYGNPTVEEGWIHCLTVPREIRERNGILCQEPAGELKTLRKGEFSLPEKEAVKLPSDAVDIELSAAGNGPFRVTLEDGVSGSAMVLEAEGTQARLAFSGSLGAGRKERLAVLDREIEDVRILLDVSIAEIYINGGETVFTTRLYPQGERMTLRAEGGEGRGWELGGFQMRKG